MDVESEAAEPIQCFPSSEGQECTPTKGQKRIANDDAENLNAKSRAKAPCWATHEDQLLLHYVSNFGNRDIEWKQVVQNMAANGFQRGVAGCKSRYHRYLRPTPVPNTVTGEILILTGDSKEIKRFVSTECQTEVSFTPRDVITWISTSSCDTNGDNSQIDEQLLPSESHSSLRALLSDDDIPDYHQNSRQSICPSSLWTQSSSPRKAVSIKDSAKSSTRTSKNSGTGMSGTTKDKSKSAASQMFQTSGSSVSPEVTSNQCLSTGDKIPGDRVSAKRKSVIGELLRTSSSSIMLETLSSQGSALSNETSHSDAELQSQTTGIIPEIHLSEHSYCTIAEGTEATHPEKKKKADDQPEKVITKKPEIPQRFKPILRLWMDGVLTVTDIVNHLMNDPIMKEAVVDCLAKRLGEHPDTLGNRIHGKLSVLMKKEYEHMSSTTARDIVAELKTEFPELHKILIHMMHGNTQITGEQLQSITPRLAMVYSIILQSRNPSLSCLQRILTAILSDHMLNTKVYDKLNKVGITLSYTTALSLFKDVKIPKYRNISFFSS